MKTKLISLLVSQAVSAVLRTITVDQAKEFIDDVLFDPIENFAAKNSIPGVAAIIDLARTATEIPDDIGGDED